MSSWGTALAWGLSVAASALWVLWAGALVLYDARYRRLPNSLTVPAAVLAVLSAFADSWLNFARFSPWWGVFWPALYFALTFVRSGIGGGDIKLALPLGLATSAFAGPLGVLLAIALASVISLAWATARKQRDCPHGPGMLAASLVVIACSPCGPASWLL